MAIQFLNGSVLIRGGQVGMSSDCCCDDEPCIQCQPCPYCWSSLSSPCNLVDSVTITIDGATFGTDNTCDCESLNGTYVMDVPTYGCFPNTQTWQPLTLCRFTIPPIVVNFGQEIIVRARWLFSAVDIPLTSQTELDAWVGITGYKFCNPVTIYKGHFMQVFVDHISYYPPPTGRRFWQKMFLYSFNNSDIKPGCPDDQLYGLCSGLLGGSATYSNVSGGYDYIIRPASCDTSTLILPEFCDLSNITVTIGDPVITATPPPPPPP